MAIEHSSALGTGSAAVVMQIFLGLRPTEAGVRLVRDLDDDGRVLWVPFSKHTEHLARLASAQHRPRP